MKTVFKLEERVDICKNGEVIYSDSVTLGYYSCRRNAFAAIKPMVNNCIKITQDLFLQTGEWDEEHRYDHTYLIREVELNLNENSGYDLLNMAAVVLHKELA